MSAHATDAHPLSLAINLIIVLTEVLGAVLASTVSDSIIKWGSFAMVGMGLGINILINRKKILQACKEVSGEIWEGVKEFLGR